MSRCRLWDLPTHTVVGNVCGSAGPVPCRALPLEFRGVRFGCIFLLAVKLWRCVLVPDK